MIDDNSTIKWNSRSSTVVVERSMPIIYYDNNNNYNTPPLHHLLYLVIIITIVLTSSSNKNLFFIIMSFLNIVYHYNTYPKKKCREATQEATDTYEYSAPLAFYTAGNQIEV